MRLFTLGSKSTSSNSTWHSGAVLTPKPLKTTYRSKIGSLLILIIFGLAILLPFNMNAQGPPSITGHAPMDYPAGGFGIDGDVYANFGQLVINGDNLFGDWIYDPALYDTGPGRGVLANTAAALPLNTAVTFRTVDLTGNADLNGFFGGSKFNQSPLEWKWKAGSSPQKDDMQNVMVHFDYEPDTADPNDDLDGDLWFAMAGDRSFVSGTSYIDFELFQKRVEAVGGVFTSEGTDGGRTIGDMAITIKYSSGGNNPEVIVYRWEAVPITPQTKSGFSYVELTPEPNTVFAASNINGPITVPYDAFGSNTYPQYAFAEAAINLFKVVEGIDKCKPISTVLIKTKASDQLGAELKDMITPIQVEINQPPTVTVNDPTVCSSDLPATITAVAQGGRTPYSYSWEVPDGVIDPGDVASFTTLVAGDYVVTVTDANTCVSEPDTATLTIIDNPDLMVQDLEDCEDGTTGAQDFDLDDAVTDADGGTVTFYNSSADANVPENAISDSQNVTIGDSPKTFWARSEITVNGLVCYSIASFDVTVYDNPDLTVKDLEDCEDGTTGAQDFDLDDAVTDDDGGTVTFYGSLADANVPENAISDSQNVTIGDSPKTFWARSDNDNDGSEGCFTVKSFTVTVYDNPDLTVQDLEDCEDGTTGAQDFDLDDAVTDDDGGTVTFYGSLADANVPENAISDSQNVTIGDSPKTFWARSDNDSDGSEGCFTVKSFTVTVYDNPDLMVQDLEDCEDGTTGAQDFDLDDAITDDDGGTVTFYNSSADANVPENAISDSQNVSIGDSPKTFWARSDNDSDGSEGCFTVKSFTVTVYDNPDVTTTNPEPICEGESVDLSLYVTDADNGSLSFHTSQADADGGMNALLSTIVSPPLGPTTYYVRSENTTDSSCFSTATIVVTVITCAQEGCTLGYWKNHTDRWPSNDPESSINEVCKTYTTCYLYKAIFEKSTLDADLTLLEALNLEGNTDGENLARQSVAALLNICSGEVSYPKFATVEALVLYVDAAWGPEEPTVNDAGWYLDGLNQSGCPLSGSSATTAPSTGCPSGNGDKLEGTSSTFITSDANLISASPVPFKETLNVKYDFDYSSAASIQIFDLQGRLLQTFKEANATKGNVSQLSIDFRTQPNQVYILKVTTDRDVFDKKIMSDK